MPSSSTPSTPTLTTIPTISLRTPHPLLLTQLRHALLTTGFLYLTDSASAVPELPALIAQLVGSLPRLFALPDEEKERISLDHSPHFLGYSGVGSEVTARRRDEREQFEFASELKAVWKEGEESYLKLLGPNQFPSPEHLPEIRGIIESYINALTRLSTHFLTLVGEALSLPPSTLPAFLSPQHRLKVIHYPSSPSSTHTQGVGPHKDSSGWFTFLLQASPHANGLQALSPSSTAAFASGSSTPEELLWLDVPPLPESFVVNTGQAFEAVTGGLCKAAVHRVVSDQDRYSVAFFQGVRGEMTKGEMKGLWRELAGKGLEEEAGRVIGDVESAFWESSGDEQSWGEWQVGIKVRSHPVVGRKFYAELMDKGDL